MRVMVVVGLFQVVACNDDSLLPNERPPPPDAVAECRVVHSGNAIPTNEVTTTYWLDRRGQVIRVDDDIGVTVDILRDDAGRLVDVRTVSVFASASRTRYVYEHDRITEFVTFTDPIANATTVIDLVDGRAMHQEGPLEKPPDERSTADYTYDSAGRLTSRRLVEVRFDGTHTSSADYLYDARGRFFRANREIDGKKSVRLLSYTADTASELAVEAFELGGGRVAQWSYSFDSERRIMGETLAQQLAPLDTDQTITFAYADAEIDEEVSIAHPQSTFVERTFVRAMGPCEAPQRVTMPPAPLPIALRAGQLHLIEPVTAAFLDQL